MQQIKEKIIQELRKSDRRQGELYDLVKPTNYQELWGALSQLSKEGKIRHYWDYSDSSPCLVYALSLPEKPKPKPLIQWWQHAAS